MTIDEVIQIDEAIQRYTDNAEYERTHGNLQGCLEFKQLAKLLKELRAYATEEEARTAGNGYKNGVRQSNFVDGNEKGGEPVVKEVE